MIKIVFFPQHTKLGQSVQKLRPAAHKADDSYQVLGLCRSSGAFEERNNSVQLLQELGSRFLAADLKGQKYYVTSFDDNKILHMKLRHLFIYFNPY